jgi:beta-lactam-binding protein with PASTA domain
VKAGSTVTLVVSRGPEPPKQATVPDGLVGASEADATAAVSAAGLAPVVVEEASDTVPDGVVVGVDPAEGATVPLGSKVTIVVSTGPAAGSGGSTAPSDGSTGGTDGSAGTPTSTPSSTSTPGGDPAAPTTAPTEAATKPESE